MQDAGCRMQDAGSRMQDAGCRMQDAGSRMQDAGKAPSCILHPVSCIPFYSYLNASIGFTLTAFLAGIMPATAPATTSIVRAVTATLKSIPG